jgi:hypothetical protein
VRVYQMRAGMRTCAFRTYESLRNYLIGPVVVANARAFRVVRKLVED